MYCTATELDSRKYVLYRNRIEQVFGKVCYLHLQDRRGIIRRQRVSTQNCNTWYHILENRNVDFLSVV